MFWFSKVLEYIAMQYFENKTLQYIGNIGKSPIFQENLSFHKKKLGFSVQNFKNRVFRIKSRVFRNIFQFLSQ